MHYFILTLSLLFFLALDYFIHRYFYWRLVCPLLPAGPARQLGAIILLLLALALFLPFVATRLPLKIQTPLAWLGYLWMGFIVFLLVTLGGMEIIQLLGRWLKSDFFQSTGWPRIRAVSALLLSLLITGGSMYNALKAQAITRYQIKIPQLPAAFEGFTIAQLSDLHISSILQHQWLEKRVAETMALNADLIAITGDLTDGYASILQGELAPLKKLSAPYGVFFITGNHEYIYDYPGWHDYLATTSINLLENRHQIIRKEGQQLYLLGVNDLHHDSDFAAATTGIPPESVTIALAHQPNSAKEGQKYPIDLLLSGHTHGGQIWPFSYAVDLAQPWVKGWYKVKDMQLIVSQGTGFWGPPMRLGSHNEIILITLTK